MSILFLIINTEPLITQNVPSSKYTVRTTTGHFQTSPQTV